MSALDPLLLMGLGLIGLPILIHFINRKRAVRRPMPTIEFLLKTNRRLARRLKLKQLLLLLLRISLFVLLPLALARPYLEGGAMPGGSGGLPTAVVFIMDDSFSMAQGDGDGTLFDRARQRLLDQLSELRSQDRVALVLAHSPPTAPVEEPVEDAERVREAVMALSRPSPSTTDLPGALALARDILAGSELPARRTVLITDNARHGWDRSTVLPADLAGLGPVEIIDVTEGDSEENRGNLAITGGGHGESRTGTDTSYDLWATVHNFGSRSRTGAALDLILDGAPAGRSLVDLGPGEEVTAEFTLSIPSGGLHRAEFRLEASAPDVEIDNHHYLTLWLDQVVDVLLVNGDPRPIPYRDELFYLERALATGPDDLSGVSATVVGDQALEISFDRFDVVVLANVATLPRGRVAELARFVREGGGLLITMGDRVEPDHYNGLLADLLPKPLRSVRELCHRRDPDANLLATRVARVDTTHPIFRVFDLPGGESIQSVGVYSYVLLEPSASVEARTLATYGDGGPALVERDYGAGRVALLTTSIDRDWTDWPIRTAYLPMMRRLVRHLARRGTGTAESQALVGERWNLDVEAQNPERVLVVDPDGGRHALVGEALNGPSLFYTPVSPGHYLVSLTISGVLRTFDELMFSANLDPAESDPTKAESSLVESFLDAAREGGSDEVSAAAHPERRISLWPWLLLGFVLFLAIESAVAVRRRLYGRIIAWLKDVRLVSHPGYRIKHRLHRPGRTKL